MDRSIESASLLSVRSNKSDIIYQGNVQREYFQIVEKLPSDKVYRGLTFDEFWDLMVEEGFAKQSQQDLMFKIFMAFASQSGALFFQPQTSSIKPLPLLSLQDLRALIFVIRKRYDAGAFEGRVIEWSDGKQYVIG